MAGVCITATVPFCEIGNDTKNNALVIQGIGTVSAFTAAVADVNPYEISNALTIGGTSSTSSSLSGGSWISPHIPLMAIAFDRYAVKSLGFHYEPQATSTAADRLVLAWTDDTSHPFLSAAGCTESKTVPTQLGLLVTPHSVAFMPWKEWRMNVPISMEPRYLYDYGASSGPSGFVYSERWFNFGAVSCIGSAAPSPIIYGILYADIALCLIDPVPIISSFGSQPGLRGLVRNFLSKRQTKSDEKIPSESKELKENDSPTFVMVDPALGAGNLPITTSVTTYVPLGTPTPVRTGPVPAKR